MTTKAEQMITRWQYYSEPIESVERLARGIDPRCHVYTFLYSEAARIVFSDGSVINYGNGCLTKGSTYR